MNYKDKFSFIGLGDCKSMGRTCLICYGSYNPCAGCKAREERQAVSIQFITITEQENIRFKIATTPEEKAPSIATNPYIELLKTEIDYLKKKIAYLENK